MTDFGMLDAQFFGLTVEALTDSASGGDRVVERAGAIEGEALNAAGFPVDTLDTAFAFGKLLMLARVAGMLGEEQGALEALAAIAVDLVELPGGQTDAALI